MRLVRWGEGAPGVATSVVARLGGVGVHRLVQGGQAWNNVRCFRLARSVHIRASGDRERDDAWLFRARLIERDSVIDVERRVDLSRGGRGGLYTLGVQI